MLTKAQRAELRHLAVNEGHQGDVYVRVLAKRALEPLLDAADMLDEVAGTLPSCSWGRNHETDPRGVSCSRMATHRDVADWPRCEEHPHPPDDPGNERYPWAPVVLRWEAAKEKGKTP